MTSIKSSSTAARSAVTMLFVLGVGASPAHAQAWVPAKGEGTVSVAFQNAFVKQHLLITQRADLGHIQSNTVLTDVSFGVTDKIALDVSLPFVSSKYNGPRPHQLPIDGGAYHGTFQDFRFALRYNVTRRGAVITPYVGTIMPSHDYTYFAHSAAGRRLHELQVGTYVAKLLDPALPGVFVQARYAYGFTQRVLDISHNRSMADLEIGYFVNSSFRVFALATGQVTHGGIDIPPNFGQVATLVQRQHHDQIARDNLLNVGGGASWSLSDSVDLFGSVIHMVAGRNGHLLNRGVTVGLSWRFRRPGAEPEARGPEGSLVRCMCQKAS